MCSPDIDGPWGECHPLKPWTHPAPISGRRKLRVVRKCPHCGASFASRHGPQWSDHLDIDTEKMLYEEFYKECQYCGWHIPRPPASFSIHEIVAPCIYAPVGMGTLEI